MKYWNKDKEKRRNWPTASPPLIYTVKSAHKWCTNNASKGRFYHHYTNTRWWFEYEEDALMFTMMWSGK